MVDDHSLFRESLSRLLQAESDFRIVGTFASAKEALSALDRMNADIVLLDYDLGEEQGTLFLTEAKKKAFPGRILMVTAGMNDSDILHALENGSAGIFLKHSPPAQLVEAIYRIMNGEAWLDPKAVNSLLAAASDRKKVQHDAQPLNGRERVVLKSVFEGLTNKEIAARLQISETSVKAVIQHLFEKTGVRTRSQLVRTALENHSQDWLA